MNIRLTAQTLSDFVANAITYAAVVGYDGLANSFSIIDYLFDFFTVDHLLPGDSNAHCVK